MSTELAKREPTTLEIIGQIANAPNFDAARMEVLERMIALKERTDKQERENEFAAAMARLQAKLPQIDRRGKIIVSGQERSRYAKLEDLDTQIKPYLAEEGFSFSFDTQAIAGSNDIRMIARLSHRAGHYEEKHLDLPNDDSGAKSKVQQRGSTVSYGRRYLIKMALGIVERDEDNDGQGNPELITAKDLATVKEQIDAKGVDVPKFLEFLRVATFEEIQRRDVPKALALLRAKVAKKEESK